MFKNNILNLIIASSLLMIATIYLSKEEFNHSGPKENIWKKSNDITITNPVIDNHKSISNYEEALKEAKISDKKILIVFGAEWCTWCRKLEITINSPQVKTSISENSIIYIHINTEKNKNLSEKYKIKGIPSYFLIDKNENIIRSGSGFKNPNNFVNWLNGRWGENQTFLSWIFGR